MSFDMDRRTGFVSRMLACLRPNRRTKVRKSRKSLIGIGSGGSFQAGGGFAELESRDVPAIVSWTGAASNGLWSDARNWSGNTVPGTADEVKIGTSSTSGSKVTIDVATVIARIESTLPITFAGTDASLRVTGGDSKLLAGLDLNYAGLAVQGATARLTISGGLSQAVSGLVVATSGGQLEWKGLKSLDNMVVYANPGSKVSLPDVTTATNISELMANGGTLSVASLTSHVGGLASVMDGGSLQAPLWADATGTFIEATGATTRIELPALTNIDQGRFRADAGATIVANSLKKVTIGTATAWSFSWFVGNGSRLSLPSLTTIFVAPPRGPVEATDARILLRGSGQVDFSPTSQTWIDGKLTLSIAGTSKVSASLILGPKVVLSGQGTITGSLDNSGSIVPTGDSTSYGTITIGGPFVNRPGSTIDMQLGNATNLDRIIVQSQATILGGAFKVSLLDDFGASGSALPVGNFPLITWTTWAGQFTTAPDLLQRADGTGITSQTRYEPTGLVLALGQHRTDNDVISVSDLVVKEGNTPTSYGYFVIKRTGPMTVPVTVNYQVIAGSAVSGVHFNFPGGPITFAPGETERRIRFVIRGNKVYKGNVSFQVRLTSVSDRAELGQPLATVTIQEDDPAPKPRPVPKPVPKPIPKPRPQAVRVVPKPVVRVR